MAMFRHQYPERMPDDEYRQEHVLIQAQGAIIRDRIEAICLEFPGYCYRRVTNNSSTMEMVINHKQILRLMWESNLLCRVRQKWVKKTDSKHPFARFPNLILDMVVSRMNQVWLADINYIGIRNGFVYLAGILDAYSRREVGYAVSAGLETSDRRSAADGA